MIIKVKHNELKNYADHTNKNSALLENEIDSVIMNVEKLGTIWKGDDYDKFKDNILSYFTRMKVIPNTLSTISSFIKKVDDNYIESDESFARELRNEAELNG